MHQIILKNQNLCMFDRAIPNLPQDQKFLSAHPLWYPLARFGAAVHNWRKMTYIFWYLSVLSHILQLYKQRWIEYPDPAIPRNCSIQIRDEYLNQKAQIISGDTINVEMLYNHLYIFKELFFEFPFQEK